MANSNVDFQTQLANMQESFGSAMEGMTKQLQTQGEVLIGIVKAFKEGGMGDTLKDVESLSEALNKAGNEAMKMGDKGNGLSTFGKMFKQATKESDTFRNGLNKWTKQEVPAMIAAGAGAMTGFIGGLKSSWKLLTSVKTAGMSVLGVMGNFVKSIITFPFKMLQGLIHMADQGGSNELAEALEKIRTEFGYLKKTAGGAIVEMSRSMKGELSNTGLSVYRIFGNLAKRLEYFLEYAKNVGPAFDTIMHNIGQGGAEALGAYNKALGFTAEGQKAVGEAAMAAGRPVNAINQEIANYSLQLSDAFGVTMKEVSRSVGNMMADVTHFGHLAVKELTQAAVYTRKLGIDFKALGGVMDKFMNFDETAEGAARLSQAFGLNIDALELMKAQDPAQKLEMLRKAFFRTGKTIETMTAQERRYLAQQTGLDDASLKLAFSLRSQGLSYDQITKKGDNAKKKQLTQAEAMVKLAGAIERIVQSGSGDGLGFVDKFFKGFERGIRRTREFREIMRNLRRDLRATLYAGVETGRAFVHAFPGIQDFFGGLAGFFEKGHWRAMLRGVVDSFKGFFEDLTGNNPNSFLNFSQKLKRNFLAFFDSRSEAGRRFLQGVKMIATAFKTIIIGMLKETIKGLITGVTFITDLLTGRKTLGSLGAGQAQGFLGQLFGEGVDIYKAIEPLGTRLWEGLKTLFTEVMTKVSPYLSEIVTTYIGGALTFAISSALLKGILAGVSEGVIKKGLGALKDRLTRANPAQAVVDAGNSAGNAGRAATEGAAATSGSSDVATEVIKAANKSGAEADKTTITGSTIAKMALIALFITAGLIIVLVAIGQMAKYIKENNLSVTEMIGASISVIAAGIVVAAAAGVVMIVSRLPAGAIQGMLPGLLAIGATVLAMLAVTAAIVATASLFSASSVMKATLLMGVMTGFFIGATIVTAAAMALGAIIVGTSIFGGGALAVGMSAMVLVVGIMTASVMEIMHILNRFQPSTGFNTTVAAFTDVMRAIGAFSGPLLSSLDTINGHWTEFASTRQRNLETNMRKIKDLIVTMGTQVTGIISAIMSATGNMTPADIEKGKALAGLLQALGPLATSLQPPAGLLDSTFMERLQTPDSIVAKMMLFRQGILQTGRVMVDVVRLVQGQVAAIAGLGWTETSVKGVQVFAAVLEGLGSFAKSLTPSPAMITALSDAASATGSGGWLKGLTNYMNTVIFAIGNSGLIDKIKEAAVGIITAMATLSTSEAEKLKSIAPIIGPIMNAVSAIANVLSANTDGATPTGAGALYNAAVLTANRTLAIKGFIDGIKDVIPSIIDRIAHMNLSTAQASSIKNAAVALKAILESVALLPSMADSFTKNGRADVSDEQKVRDMVSKAATVIYSISASDSGLRQPLQQFATFAEEVSKHKNIVGNVTTLKNVFESVGAIAGSVALVVEKIGTGYTEKIRTMTGFMTNLSDGRDGTAIGFQQALNNLGGLQIPNTVVDVTNRLKAVMDHLGDTANSISRAGGMVSRLETMAAARVPGRMVHAVVDMVNQVNATSTELANAGESIPNANVALRRFSDGVGLTGNQTLTINKRNLTINVPITVTIDGRELQTVLVNTAALPPMGGARRLATQP